MNPVMEPFRPNYSAWDAHYKAMADGTLERNGKIWKVKPIAKSDVGVKLVTAADDGIKQIVTPTQQVVEMAKAKKRAAMKEKKGAKPISHTRRRRTFKKAKKPPASTAIKRVRKK